MTGIERLRVLAVVADMERHVLGHEGMEDSPVARWARELREAMNDAMKSDASDESEAQKPSCADTTDAPDATFGGRKVTREDAEAIAWVREHGGIDGVKEEWNRRSNLDRQLGKAQAKVERQQRHIEAIQGKLRDRRERVIELHKTIAELRKRAMPEGMEWLVKAWPRFEDDAPLKFGDMALIDGDVDMIEAVQLWIHGRPIIYGDGDAKRVDACAACERFERREGR